MPAQDELFQLIKSLTSSEKRYFKVNASKGGDAKSNYLQLFEAMDAQNDEYDEQKLKAKHSKKAFVKYLSAEKKHLREQIMKQMRAYRSELSVDNKINELLQDERFYRDKGLKQHREKAILKAKGLATKYERFHLLQEILEKEIAYVEEFEKKSLTEPVLHLLTELKQLSLKQQTFLELWSKNKEIFSAYRSGKDIKDKVFKNLMNKTIAEVEQLKSDTSDSFRLKQAFCRAYSNFHNIFGEHIESYEATLREYELFQSNPQFKKELHFSYKICLANLISRAQLAGKTKEFLQFINELKTLPVSSFNEEGEVFQNVYFLEHLHYINTGNLKKAESLIPEIEEGLNKYSDKINKARVLTFQYNIMIMYFILHKFKKAIQWAEKILVDKSEIKQDLTTVTRVLLPIFQYELGRFELVESQTRAAYRHLKAKNRIHEFEHLLIQYLNNMPFSQDSSEFQQKLTTFYNQIEVLIAEENTSKIQGLEEIYIWTKSRINHKPMHEFI